MPEQEITSIRIDRHRERFRLHLTPRRVELHEIATTTGQVQHDPAFIQRLQSTPLQAEQRPYLGKRSAQVELGAIRIGLRPKLRRDRRSIHASRTGLRQMHEELLSGPGHVLDFDTIDRQLERAEQLELDRWGTHF
jgi:hypothetical protein